MAERNDRIKTRTRMYDDIKTDILESIPVLAPNWTSHGTDEPGMAILDILAGVSDSLFFNLDRRARENFLSTAILPESIYDLAAMLHYRPKRWVSAEAQLIVNVPQVEVGEEGDTTYTRPNYTVPALTPINLKNNRKAVTTEELVIPGDFSGQLTTSLLEGVYKTYSVTITPENIFSLLLPDTFIAEQLFEVYVGNELWYDSTDHPLNADLDNFYYITKNADGRYELGFRTSRGRIPTYGQILEIRYLESSGESLPADFLDANAAPVSDNTLTWSYTDFENGSLPETLQQIRDRAPAKNSTSDRAVNTADYKELAKQLPNVKSVFVRKSRTGWNTVEIFVATKDGSPASIEQLNLIRDYFDARNNLVVGVRTLPATFRRFILGLSFRARNGYNASKVLNEVRIALEKAYSYEKLDFASAIRISDIYAIVETIPGVDYSNINELYWDSDTPSIKNLVPVESEYPLLYRLNVTLE